MTKTEEWTGRRVGNYAILRKLGEGGMGVVYAAEQASLGREIALKVLRRTPATSPALVERFRREARIVSTLAHPNVVTVFDFGEEPDLLYFAMELVSGHPLRNVMTSHGPLSEGETVTVVRDVASALASAHAKGVIHRDLKPENVMLVPTTGRAPLAKVLDFGIARLIRPDDDGVGKQSLTGTGTVVGTPAYIAPELIAGEQIDGRADLYALGVIWFEMLAGRLPFEGATPMAYAVQQINNDAPRVSSFVGVSKSVDDLIGSLLSREPAGRPNDASELLSRLDKIEAQVGGLRLTSDSLARAATVKHNAGDVRNGANAGANASANMGRSHDAATVSGQTVATGISMQVRPSFVGAGNRDDSQSPAWRRPAIAAAIAFTFTLVVASAIAVGLLLRKGHDEPVALKPVEPVEVVEVVKPVEPIEPVDIVKPVEPIEPVDVVQPIEPVEPDVVKPIEPADVVKPIEPVAAKPAKPKPTPAKPHKPDIVGDKKPKPTKPDIMK